MAAAVFWHHLVAVVFVSLNILGPQHSVVILEIFQFHGPGRLEKRRSPSHVPRRCHRHTSGFVLPFLFLSPHVRSWLCSRWNRHHTRALVDSSWDSETCSVLLTWQGEIILWWCRINKLTLNLQGKNRIVGWLQMGNDSRDEKYYTITVSTQDCIFNLWGN
jgi:hypothetical protein